MTEFFTKYPDADPSRFVFKDGKVWFKLDPDDKNRLLDIESDTFQRMPSWKKYLTSYKERGFGIWFTDGTVQAYEENTTTKDINKFKVYVTDSEYFEADLTPLSITNTSDKNYKKNPYLVAIMAAFVSTYICGISTKHLEFNKNTPGIITSMVRYHLYYQISKFLKDSSKLAIKYFTHFSYSFYEKMSPTTDVWTDAFT